MKKEYIRTIQVFEDHFIEFKKTLSKDLYEIRVEEGGNIFRVFCCFDEGKLIILFNGIQKKSQKTPKEALDKAEALMKKYFELKKEQKNEK